MAVLIANLIVASKLNAAGVWKLKLKLMLSSGRIAAQEPLRGALMEHSNNHQASLPAD